MEEYTFFTSDKIEPGRGFPEDCPSMLDYLAKFDPILWKYSRRDEKNGAEHLPLPLKVYAEASRFEEQQEFGNLSKKEYSYIKENLKLVYGNEKLIREDILAYHRTEKKIINGYLGIPQLNKLFDEDYFNFEWDMHVGQNFSEHRNQYYRDHFIHQIRNLYSMLIMLDRFGFYDASAAIFRERGISKVSEFVFKKWKLFQSDRHLPQTDFLRGLCPPADKKDPPSAEEVWPPADAEAYIEHFFFQYVIYASSMLSALFHDMGYPICHFLEVRHRISDYDHTMYMFTHNAFDSFDQLASKLSSSLLFTVVSTHELKRRLDMNKRGKYDHGAYSAVAFLLQFYDNGILFSLSPEKQCAIELAAVAIYNHTAKFNVVKYKEDNNYYTQIFRQNPIAFLLRFCDDLQEWGRRYFEISDASDLMFCPRCGAPFLKEERPGKDSQYVCLCGKSARIRRPDIFDKRKLYLVTVADRLIVRETRETQTLDASIHYDLYSLLMLSHINSTYAKYRAEDLCELKKRLSDQNYSVMSGGKLRFEAIRLDYFMTANPLLIKLKILERYVRRYRPNGVPRAKELSAEETPHELLNAHSDFSSAKLLAQTVFQSQGPVWSEQMNRFWTTSHAYRFYFNLLKYCLTFLDPAWARYSGGYKRSYEGFLEPYKQSDPLYYDTMRILTDDCIRQYKKEHYLAHGSAKERYDSYYAPYIPGEYEANLYHYIGVYTDVHNSFNDYRYVEDRQLPPYISYFKDIQLFQLMNEKIQS